MCGRYQRRSDKQQIAEVFQLGNIDGLALEFAPDYNAAPQSLQPVIVWDNNFGARSAHMMFWRFLPPYVTDPRKLKFDTINARGETLLDSNVWRHAFLHNRCLVPADTFIEWKHVDAKTKLPWIFAMKDGSPFALGGVYCRWRSPDRKTEMETFAIITTGPNKLLAEKTGHDRMPLIIEPRNYQRWLEPGNKNQPPIDLIRPFDSDRMKAWEADRRLNNVRNNDSSLGEPLMEGKSQEGIGEFPKRKTSKRSKPSSTEEGNDQLGLF